MYSKLTIRVQASRIKRGLSPLSTLDLLRLECLSDGINFSGVYLRMWWAGKGKCYRIGGSHCYRVFFSKSAAISYLWRLRRGASVVLVKGQGGA